MTTPNSPGAALITGGTTGIGLATARVLHQQGFAVLVTGHNPDTIAAAKRALPDDVVVLRADVRVLADAARVADEIRALPSPLSVVFLNAGIHRMTPIESVDEAMFDDIFAVNVKGQYFTLQKVLPLLGDGGSVIFNGALGARKGLANWSVVSATKGALMALVPSLAIELSARRIRGERRGSRPDPHPRLRQALARTRHDRDVHRVHGRARTARADGRRRGRRQPGRLSGLAGGQLHHRGMPAHRRRHGRRLMPILRQRISGQPMTTTNAQKE